MPRLRNTRTGAVVNVSDVTAARLGAEFEEVGNSVDEFSAAEKSPKSPRRRKVAKKPDDK